MTVFSSSCRSHGNLVIEDLEICSGVICSGVIFLGGHSRFEVGTQFSLFVRTIAGSHSLKVREAPLSLAELTSRQKEME